MSRANRKEIDITEKSSLKSNKANTLKNSMLKNCKINLLPFKYKLVEKSMSENKHFYSIYQEGFKEKVVQTSSAKKLNLESKDESNAQSNTNLHHNRLSKSMENLNFSQSTKHGSLKESLGSLKNYNPGYVNNNLSNYSYKMLNDMSKQTRNTSFVRSSSLQDISSFTASTPKSFNSTKNLFKPSFYEPARFNGFLFGADIEMSSDNLVAKRRSTESVLLSAYIFGEKTIRLNEILKVRIVQCEQRPILENLIFGLTTTCPLTLSHDDLPLKAEFLAKRPQECWLLVDQFYRNCREMDELFFMIALDGSVRFSVNSQSLETILFTLPPNLLQSPLWFFFDLLGSVRCMKALGMQINTKIKCNQTPKPLYYVCISCRFQKAEAAFYKCGHRYMCVPCANSTKMTSGKCPICYCAIEDVITIFP